MTVVRTDPARCQGTSVCVGACPVDAIQMKAGQAQVIAARCIACAACVGECPQQALVVRSDVALVQNALTQGRKVVASVAPSALAYFPVESFSEMAQALRRLGFADASEATLGAAMVADEYGRLLRGMGDGRPIITSTCPAAISLIEKHNPDLIPYLAPVVSPMIAHARWLKRVSEMHAFVVHVGPCVAAKSEADDETVGGAVGAALTFSELADWMKGEGIRFPSVASSDEHVSSEEVRSSSASQSFSLAGGLARSAYLDPNVLGGRVVIVSGLTSCLQTLESLRSGRLEVDLVELMLCSGGCLQGPGMRSGDGISPSRQEVLADAWYGRMVDLPPRSEWPDLKRAYSDRSPIDLPDTGDRIDEIPADGGQAAPERALRRGSFRDRALAAAATVLQTVGIAEETTNVSDVKRREEAMAKMVLDLTPNLVIMVDENLHIVAMSPSAERAFGCDLATVRDRPLSDILSPIDDFVRARKYNRSVVKSKVHYRPDLIVEQTVVPATDENMLVAIMRDITAEEKQRKEVGQLMHETITRTQEVIDFQMQVAHEIASLLGETTAKSKIQLGRLIELVKGMEGAEIP